jgi:hypothetical protein
MDLWGLRNADPVTVIFKDVRAFSISHPKFEAQITGTRR